MNTSAGTTEFVRIFSVRTGSIENLPRVILTDGEWRALLTPEQFEVARKKGTEYAFTGRYHACREPGIYSCACYRIDLFDSKTKFDSGAVWPSFFTTVSELNIMVQPDFSRRMVRTEVLCARCGAHRGHVFENGPAPTGKRYCMNSTALKFIKEWDLGKI